MHASLAGCRTMELKQIHKHNRFKAKVHGFVNGTLAIGTNSKFVLSLRGNFPDEGALNVCSCT